MEIWAHAMVKNDARWLWYAVTSVIDHVDKLLLWDTGSTDLTLEIEKDIIKKYGNKILFKKREQNSPKEFMLVRQEMLDETKSDWFIMLDGDEIWWNSSISKLISEIQKNNKTIESVVVPTINVVGDIFHYQSESAGMYRFGNLKGHYNLRAIKRNIPGLHSQGEHGVWGWADEHNLMIQDRNTFIFVNAPYLHATFLNRSSDIKKEEDVSKRKKKLKYEIGRSFPYDFYYPEVFFKDCPDFIPSPWYTMSGEFKSIAFVETPIRNIKRRIWPKGVGY